MDTVDTEKKPCNCCGELILSNAKVCFHCSRDQNIGIRILKSIPQWIALGISIVILAFTWWQKEEATKQRISAEAAFNKADAASNKAEAAERSVTNIANATIPLFESILYKTGRADGGYSTEEGEKLIRNYKNALPKKQTQVT